MLCIYECSNIMDDDCEIRLETATVVGDRRRAFGCGQSRVQLIFYQLGCRLYRFIRILVLSPSTSSPGVEYHALPPTVPLLACVFSLTAAAVYTHRCAAHTAGRANLKNQTEHSCKHTTPI